MIDIELLGLLSVVGFIAGFIDAIAGGGGLLTIPTLLATGLPPHIALGTNKLAASFGSFTASLTFYRKRLFDPIFWWRSIAFTAIGAIMGTLVVSTINTQWLEKLLPIIIFVIAIYTLFNKHMINSEGNLPKKDKTVKKKQCLQGLTLGFYDGVAGPGTGAFWTVSSTALYKLNILLSSGLARSTNFVSNICSLATFIYLAQVNFTLGITMGVFIMFGSWVGAHSAIKYGNKFIKPIFLTVVIGMSLYLAYRAW
ncbi:TSUP family transporter [Thalassotalea sp. LPB0316]|uniref:TSUP family transporter n=1 Tax=Thalassotalea sp. LPB0316 TaxID=2769490 RepID=UPI001868931F|nr:TSUP family transporter [Thalassotalea sp. LPB0316]QOL27272.1 TSUP family transporter [Thalassotalea sp. LPB0316]